MPVRATDAILVQTEPLLSEDVLQEILGIAEERAILLTELKCAVLADDIKRIKQAAAALCGIGLSE
jgi:hypothetical protein